MIPIQGFREALVAAFLLALTSLTFAQSPIVQPGAPGQPSREISADEAIELAALRYTAADVKFMRDMVPHHSQALDMSVLAPERSQDPDLIELARKIETTQRDEIAYMQSWLTERGEPEAPMDWHHHAHGDHAMEGMATHEEMEALAASRGEDFDRMFLSLMIAHHEGALVMVDDLLDAQGSAQDPAFYEFVSHIKTDQTSEIERMTAMYNAVANDPRVGLAPGFRDAGEAIWNLRLASALPKPEGFFDPENPAGRAAMRARSEDSEDKPRPTLLDFANTDMAFFDDVLIAGSYHGFNIYRLVDDGVPELMSSVVCPGGQGDVSVVENLLIMSVEQTRGRLDCGLIGVAEDVSEERFRGLRIFDISDLARPQQVGAVQTCRGSHTHSVVSGPDENGRILIYNSGTAPVREEDELPGCINEDPYRDERTALFRIDVIEVFLDRPEEARIIDSPAVFADPDSGNLAGLWERGDHGPGTQTTNETNHCHDITVFPELGIAAGACSGNGILFDISDPENPTRIDEVVDPGFAYWHSATFNNTGTKVVFTDEWGGGTRPRCRASDPRTWGANAIYDIIDNELVFAGYYKMPAAQSEVENCVAHNGSLIPVPGRDIMVQAWYQGGISVFDFSDSTRPVEIAYFDRGPIHEDELVTGGYWSAYWYGERMYGTGIVRGLDTLALEASEFLTADEIRAAELAEVGGLFNPQTQLAVRWPAEPVVARAWRDQLNRGGHLTDDQNEAIEQALSAHERGAAAARRQLSQLAEEFEAYAQARTGLTRTRFAGLAETLSGLAQ
ncbi:DUF305 domain-containing protein [Leptolyngbya valderiana BDU 20041]|nr:DUF305 domain-containing protein [Leptolyngbya valderiana BDU 20041]